MGATTIAIATFGVVTFTIISGCSLVAELLLADRSLVNQRLQEEFPERIGIARRNPLFKDLKVLHAETAPLKPSVWQRFETMVQQSGLHLQPKKLLVIASLAATTACCLAWLTMLNWLAAILAGAAAASLPIGFVQFRRQRRIHRLRIQLPDAFDMMSRAVRTGQTMQGAMQLVASQLKPPLSMEFARCCEHQNLGLPQATALRQLAQSTGVIELQMFVVAVLVQRQSGGNPVEILKNLSEIIRKRIRLLAKVRALTGEGRLQAAILSVLPLAAFLAIYLLNSSYAQVLLDRPRIILGVLMSEAIGAVWIRRIVSFSY